MEATLQLNISITHQWHNVNCKMFYSLYVSISIALIKSSHMIIQLAIIEDTYTEELFSSNFIAMLSYLFICIYILGLLV